MRTLQEIKLTLERNKEDIFDKYPIKSLAIFGSYARNKPQSISDVDILVEFHSPIGIRFIDLADELESILGVKVDLVSKNGMKEKYYNVVKQDLIYV